MSLVFPPRDQTNPSGEFYTSPREDAYTFPDWSPLQRLYSLDQVSVCEVQCHSSLHLASNRLEHIMRSDTWFWQRGGGSGRPQTDLAADFPTGAGELRSDSPKGHQKPDAAKSAQGHSGLTLDLRSLTLGFIKPFRGDTGK